MEWSPQKPFLVTHRLVDIHFPIPRNVVCRVGVTKRFPGMKIPSHLTSRESADIQTHVNSYFNLEDDKGINSLIPVAYLVVTRGAEGVLTRQTTDGAGGHCAAGTPTSIEFCTGALHNNLNASANNLAVKDALMLRQNDYREMLGRVARMGDSLSCMQWSCREK
ncbi:hypothetical protein CEXT_794161 [Caerostris extrusa]|uniref:Uncharacterized protein n=1 Tax=Caerostris extrusa TaxID=172846 RepID=A0AAV4SS69_CAEEX|nr:hypothetical protein CEXT_794161 [Caerostris extrusa]